MKEINILNKTDLAKEENENLNEKYDSNNTLYKNQKNLNQQEDDYNKKVFESSSDYNEDLNWINEDNMINVERFSLFSLKFWKALTFDKLDKNIMLQIGTCYQSCVNDILKNDVFRGENFYWETMKYKAINDEEMSPDFYIENIDSKKLIEIINDRSYMFKMNYKISINVKKICIIGEVKTSKARLRSGSQKMDYLTYCKMKTNFDKLFMVMYIFDKSYKDFYSSFLPRGKPIIFGYVPKLYKADCYIKMNEILKLLDAKNIKRPKEIFGEKVSDLPIKKDQNNNALNTEIHSLKVVIFIMGGLIIFLIFFIIYKKIFFHFNK